MLSRQVHIEPSSRPASGGQAFDVTGWRGLTWRTGNYLHVDLQSRLTWLLHTRTFTFRPRIPTEHHRLAIGKARNPGC